MVGFVLVLAAAVTYYSYAAQNDVPRIGAENERAWDAEVGAALSRLASGAGERAGTDASVREVIPAAPDAPTQTVPFLSPLRSARASASVAYSDTCGGATLIHVSGGSLVTDLASGASGCITFRGETAYAEAFAYRVELGGLLRIQSDRAIVLAGPPVEIGDERVALTLVDLRGASQTLGIDGAEVAVGLTPRPGALEVTSATNAQGAAWALVTDHPEAWRDWYKERFAAAGVGLTTSISCADEAASGPARGPCTLSLDMPTVTSLSVSYGRYDVAMG